MLAEPRTLTKAELAELLFERVGLVLQAKDIVDTFFEEIRDIARGDSVKLSGFGNFQVRDKPPRPGRNPKTGETIPIAARCGDLHASQKLKASWSRPRRLRPTPWVIRFVGKCYRRSTQRGIKSTYDTSRIHRYHLTAHSAKRYFTIGEVSDLCGVKPHVLRYWEQEFTQLKPVKRRGNRRYYQHHEVLLIRRIRSLLYEQGFTISGARNRLGDARDTPHDQDAAVRLSGAGCRPCAMSWAMCRRCWAKRWASSPARRLAMHTPPAFNPPACPRRLPDSACARAGLVPARCLPAIRLPLFLKSAWPELPCAACVIACLCNRVAQSRLRCRGELTLSCLDPRRRRHWHWHGLWGDCGDLALPCGWCAC